MTERFTPSPEGPAQHRHVTAYGLPVHGSRSRRLGAPVDGRSAQLRWSIDGESMEIDIAGERGLLIVPMKRYGAQLTSLLVDALDRAAPGGRRHIQISRGALLVELVLPDVWPATSRLPSVVFGVSGATENAPGATDSATQRTMSAMPLGLDTDQIDVLRAFPARRRRLAARRRQLENALVVSDDRSHLRVRSAWRAGLLGAAAFSGALLGAAAGSGPVVLSAAAVFCASAAWFAVRRIAAMNARSLRIDMEQRLLEVGGREADLDQSARSLARRIGCRDAWDAAAYVATKTEPHDVGREDDFESGGAAEYARRLARVFGAPAPSSEDFTAPSTGRRLQAWPDEVATKRPRDGAAEGFGLVAAARLVARVERDLPRAWPLVLWNPWPDRDPEERARLLLAIRETVRPRQVIAIVDASGANS